MLIEFHKSFVMEGEATLDKRKHFWSKPKDVRSKIYCTTFIKGICDESELNFAIEAGYQEQLKTNGWGKDFSGWQRVVPYQEAKEIYDKNGWSGLPTYKIWTEYIHKWPIEKVLKELTFEQFAQLCKESGISIYPKER